MHDCALCIAVGRLGLPLNLVEIVVRLPRNEVVLIRLLVQHPRAEEIRDRRFFLGCADLCDLIAGPQTPSLGTQLRWLLVLLELAIFRRLPAERDRVGDGRVYRAALLGLDSPPARAPLSLLRAPGCRLNRLTLEGAEDFCHVVRLGLLLRSGTAVPKLHLHGLKTTGVGSDPPGCHEGCGSSWLNEVCEHRGVIDRLVKTVT